MFNRVNHKVMLLGREQLQEAFDVIVDPPATHGIDKTKGLFIDVRERGIRDRIFGIPFSKQPNSWGYED